MNIKQAEQHSGVSKRNIRYYEQEGMIHPSRNAENDYREYSQDDIHRLKLIRAMRMVDMPLDQIRMILVGELEMQQAAAEQELRLKQKEQQLQTAIRFCRELGELSKSSAEDIDGILNKMDKPENVERLSQKWLQDYKKYAKAQHQKVFTFIPDDAVTTPAEFTMALIRYADQNDLELVITKEGMYPEFTIDGIEYTAERFYGRSYRFPVATIRCTAKHPEELEPDLPKGKKISMRLLHYGWIYGIVILANVVLMLRIEGMELLTTWEGWLLLGSVLAITGVSIYRFYLFAYNFRER